MLAAADRLALTPQILLLLVFSTATATDYVSLILPSFAHSLLMLVSSNPPPLLSLCALLLLSEGPSGRMYVRSRLLQQSEGTAASKED